MSNPNTDLENITQGYTDRSAKSHKNLFSKLSLGARNNYNNFKGFVKDSKNSLLDLFEYTRAEIVFGAIAGFIIFSAAKYSIETKKDRCKRLAFSEISNIERTAEKLGAHIPHLTAFNAFTNDYLMKVYEAENDSWTDIPFVKDNSRTFAVGLEYHVNPAFKFHHYEIPELATLIPQYADSVLSDFKYLNDLMNRTNDAIVELDAAWDDEHIDHTKPHVYYTEETHTDSDGHSHTERVRHVEQVYDYTMNKYTYYDKRGRNASLLLDLIQNDFKKIKTDDLFMPALKTDAENEYVMEKSRKTDLKGKMLMPEDYVLLANGFLFGSKQFHEFPVMEKLRNDQSNETDAWRKDHKTAYSYKKKTHDHSHAESKEFLTTERALSASSGLSSYIQSNLDVIKNVKEKIPPLTDLIKKYVVEGQLKPHSRAVHKMKNDIEDQVDEIYASMFPKLDIKHSNYGLVPLWGIIGAIVFGGFGAAVDYAGERYNIYGRRMDESRRRRPKKENPLFH